MLLYRLLRVNGIMFMMPGLVSPRHASGFSHDRTVMADLTACAGLSRCFVSALRASSPRQ